MVTHKLADESYRLILNYGENTPTAPKKLYACKNDRAAFQIILQSDMHYSVNVGRQEWVSAADRVGTKHERLRVAVDCPFEIKAQNVGFVTDDDRVQKADILLEANVSEQNANMPSAVWVEVTVPADATAGNYEVHAAVYSARYAEDEELVADITLPLTVLDHTLPDIKDSGFYLDLWQHNSNIARKYDVRLWSDEHFAVMEQVVRALADVGQKSVTVIASEIPWFGQGCTGDHAQGGNMFEYSYIPITRKKDGTFEYDYSIMQRYIDMCTKAGITGDIEVFGLVNVWGKEPKRFPVNVDGYPEQIKLRYFDEESGTLKYVRDGEVIKDYIRSLQDYFEASGQLARVRIAADEPSDIEKYRESMDMLKLLAPKFRCECAINHAEFIAEFGDVIDCFAPYLRCTVKEYELLMQYKRDFPDKRFLWYVCCGGAAPNTFIKSLPVESRAIGLTTAYLHLDGFLRWAFNIWPDDPRRDIRYSAFEAGDVSLIYPAYNGGVLYSLRYKNLQRGIADYELLQAVRKSRGDSMADGLLSRVFKLDAPGDYYNDTKCKDAHEVFSVDWNDWNELKREMAELI